MTEKHVKEYIFLGEKSITNFPSEMVPIPYFPSKMRLSMTSLRIFFTSFVLVRGVTKQKKTTH